MPDKKKHKNETHVIEKDNQDGKKNTSLRLEKKTLKALKIRAIEEEISVQKLIERLVVEYLEK